MPGPHPHSLVLPTLADTEALAARLAQLARPGDVLALSGALGAGKTAFARGFIHSLGIAEEVPSPTFTLVQTYQAPDGRQIAHFDLYRLESPDDVWELGWEDALQSAIVLLEWPERLQDGQRQKRLLPSDRLDIAFAAREDGAREARLTACGSWAARLAETGLGL